MNCSGRGQGFSLQGKSFLSLTYGQIQKSQYYCGFDEKIDLVVILSPRDDDDDDNYNDDDDDANDDNDDVDDDGDGDLVVISSPPSKSDSQ